MAEDYVKIVDPTNPKNVTWIEKQYTDEVLASYGRADCGHAGTTDFNPNVGAKFDVDKVGVDMLPPAALVEIARVLDFGAKKYSSYNWANGIKFSRIYASLLRHIWAWWRGENLDPETGLSHLAHAGCNVLFLLQLSETRKSFDDRPLKYYKAEPDAAK